MKKPNNKQNQPHRKTTIQHNNLTEEVLFPSFNTMDLRTIVKSTQLKKFKKLPNRKNRCLSVKQSPHMHTMGMKQILKQFKTLKALAERQKSPASASCKSRSKKKKLVSTTLKTKPHSEVNLTMKLQRTLKKLNANDYFKQDDDLIINESSVDRTSALKKQPQLDSIQMFSELNIKQLRQFCSHTELVYKKNIQFFKGDAYQSMAVKIQRAWRRYKTKKIVQRYTKQFQIPHRLVQTYNLQKQEDQISQIEELKILDEIDEDRQQFQNRQLQEGSACSEQHSQPSENQNQQQIFQTRADIQIKPQQFYTQQFKGTKITHISNIQAEQNQSASFRADQNLRALKMQELTKWNQIISIISSHIDKADNPHKLQELLKQLTKQSELNKKDLQLKTMRLKNQYQRNVQRQKVLERYSDMQKRQSVEIPQNKVVKIEMQKKRKQRDREKQRSNLSDSSGVQQFNSKKYIEYLDCDMYPLQKDKHSEKSINKKIQQVDRLIQPKKISEKKREQLLKILTSQANLYPIRLGEDQLYHSESQRALNSERNSVHQSSSRSKLNKSSSEKNIKKVIENISPMPLDFDGDYMNIQLLRQQFLEGSDPLENLHSQEMLREKLAQLQKIKNEPIFQQQDQQVFKQSKIRDPQFLKQLRKHQIEGLKFQKQIKRYQEQRAKTIEVQKQSHNQQMEQIDEVEPRLSRQTGLPLHKIQMQTVDRNISENSIEEDEKSHQDPEQISTMIFNHLIYEVLREIAGVSSLLKQFKQYSNNIKPKIRRAQKKIKKGFKTNQQQIKSFVDGLVSYLLNQQPHTFKNLQIPTGPSALQMLQYMHQGIDQQTNIEEQQDDSSVMVIPNRIFNSYWTVKQKSLLIAFENALTQQQRQNPDRHRQRFQLLKGLNKVFCRSLFDGFNECLDYQRNYGQFGQPFPWKKTPNFHHNLTLDQIHHSLQRARKRMTDVTTTFCGIIVEKDDINDLNGNENYIEQIIMLAQDLIEGEQRWVFYDDEETEILVQLSSLLALQLTLECIQELAALGH